MEKKTFKTVIKNGKSYNLLTLPDSNYFKFEIMNMYGSNIERVFKEITGKNVYGISHLIEHLAFKSPRDFSTSEFLDIGKTYGSANASTSYDRINYFFATTMNHIDLGIKYVCNCAFNNLKNITSEEFDTEKKVVYNEAKRYYDDSQITFYFESNAKILNYEDGDNTLGTLESIDNLTLEDAITIKNIFLTNNKNIYNIVYDNTVISEEDIIQKIEEEMTRFEVKERTIEISQKQYDRALHYPIKGEYFLNSDSKQALTKIVFSTKIKNSFIANAALLYLQKKAEETSLDDLIRQQHGLTYHVMFQSVMLSYMPYIVFMCDVTQGNEEKLIQLFKESINLSVDQFSKEKYNKYMQGAKLQRVMAGLNLETHTEWFYYNNTQPDLLKRIKDILANNINDADNYINDKIITYENMKTFLEEIKNMVENQEYSIVISKNN